MGNKSWRICPSSLAHERNCRMLLVDTSPAFLVVLSFCHDTGS